MNETPKRNKVLRYKHISNSSGAYARPDDPLHDYMNILGLIFSMFGLMMRIKWSSWIAFYCAFVSFANAKTSDDTKQIVSNFMLSIFAVVMSYLQNPTPISFPWT
ncbi:unnamed protein product [Gordionus sp. m RMFG-2023]|uniref:PAT complex subunit Asterix-like n=1 Tax=Gordionus sp. m RMFG-2023 TaxID=3053472 RepID=UPI0030E3DB2A